MPRPRHSITINSSEGKSPIIEIIHPFSTNEKENTWRKQEQNKVATLIKCILERMRQPPPPTSSLFFLFADRSIHDTLGTIEVRGPVLYVTRTKRPLGVGLLPRIMFSPLRRLSNESADLTSNSFIFYPTNERSFLTSTQRSELSMP